MYSPTAPARVPSQSRTIGLPIVAWLVLGFACVIGAFALATGVSLHATRQATADLGRMQHEFEPLSRGVRDLGDGLAAYDRAVLAFLRADTRDNRAAALAAAERLSGAATQSVDLTASDDAEAVTDLLEEIAAHQAEGFRLLAMQEERRHAMAALEQAFAALDRRIKSAGGGGIVVGNSLIAGPSIAELARALEAARHDVAGELTRGGRFADGPKGGETLLRRAFATHRAEFSVSPGRNWLSMQMEDLDAAIRWRRQALALNDSVSKRQTAFANQGDLLAARIREHVEAPAWQDFKAAAVGAQVAVERAQASIRGATIKAVLFALVALLVTAWTITRPVRRLTEGTRKLAAGDLATRVHPGGAREIEELAQAFNHMAGELAEAERAVKSYQAHLEHRVEQRTQQLRHLAEHDPLTGLPNRRQLFRRLDEMLAAAAVSAGRGAHIAVLFIDLDNFKTVNDTLGHEFGDRVLMSIGGRLRELADDHGTIARLGGDEFTLIFEYSGNAAEVMQRAEHVVAGFQRPLQIDRREVAVGASCGVALYPGHGRDAETLLRAADVALFRAKELGRNRLCVHDPSMLLQASNRFRVEQALRKAIEGGEFVLHYQPVVCLGRQRTTGVEALLRWRRDDDVIVPAGDFIAIAEQSGLMLELNEWILETAAEACARWRREGWPDARVAINVSAQQFVTGNFLLDLERLLARHGLPPQAIELELTETMLQTGAVTVETLHNLRLLGIDTALDDFGTGYSSLTSIEQLPLSRVKLDRSVIRGVDSNPRSAAIVHSIIRLCRNLGLQVTVEGVERVSQLDFLAACGEVSVQGFLMARPIEQAAIIDLVRGTRSTLDALLSEAEQQRAATLEDDLTSSVRMLRPGRKRG
ncbi:MAG TPA: EAL domain-containing protein [Steroidobacteraceae bacterium]